MEAYSRRIMEGSSSLISIRRPARRPDNTQTSSSVQRRVAEGTANLIDITHRASHTSLYRAATRANPGDSRKLVEWRSGSGCTIVDATATLTATTTAPIATTAPPRTLWCPRYRHLHRTFTITVIDIKSISLQHETRHHHFHRNLYRCCHRTPLTPP